MSIRRELFSKRSWNHPPSWPCPKCDSGFLVAIETKKEDFEHGWSSDAHMHEAWDPDWIEGVFFQTLQCKQVACRHFVVVTGKTYVDWDIQDTPEGPSQVYLTFYEPTAFSQAPPIFEIGRSVPQSIHPLILSAFNIFWVDSSSCLNKIRSCIEEILTDKKVPRFSRSNGRMRPLMLHTRVEKFKETHPEVGDFLMALKWLGNEGSHHPGGISKVERSAVLDAFEILEHVLGLVYDSRSKGLKSKARKINKKRGL